MSGRHRGLLDRGARLASVAVLLSAAACSDDDDAAPELDDETPETTEPLAIDVTPPLELSASADPDFIAAVLADDIVTADELEDAYTRFIDCLANGGAAGIYAFDLSLRVAYSEWSIAGDAANSNDQARLQATCSRDFLGDLIPRYNEANPPDPDLATRRRDSIVDCVAAIDPDIAASIPDEVTVDTVVGGASVGELQLDAAGLGAEPGQEDAVGRCIGAFGADWVAFG